MELLTYNQLIFIIAIMGIFVLRKDLISILICGEIMFLASTTNLMLFSYITDNIEGVLNVLFVLTVAAAETAIVLSVIITFYKLTKRTHIEYIDSIEMKTKENK